jgi:hypothetical protein
MRIDAVTMRKLWHDTEPHALSSTCPILKLVYLAVGNATHYWDVDKAIFFYSKAKVEGVLL